MSNSSETIIWQYTVPNAGQFDLRLVIDFADVIDEYDEGNNNNYLVVTGASLDAPGLVPSFAPLNPLSSCSLDSPFHCCNARQGIEKHRAARRHMRQSLPRVPKDRIAVIIGAKGATSKAIRNAAGCQKFIIDSDSGDIVVEWGEVGTYDPVKAMKLPDVVKAIGRGMAPNAAIRLLDDDHFFELVDLREYVGKRSNQQRRVRARIIGRQGKIRKLIEQLTNTQITIYNSTVVLVGEESGLFAARHAIEMLAGGSEHGSVIGYLSGSKARTS